LTSKLVSNQSKKFIDREKIIDKYKNNPALKNSKSNASHEEKDDEKNKFK